MSKIATIGDNMPPNPIDEALAPFGDAISEAENWADGSEVENEDQMNAVDALLKQIKAAEKAVGGAEESAAKPMFDAWKAKKAEFAPTLTDLARIKKCLIVLVGTFKAKLAAEKAEIARLAQAEVWRKAEEARKAAEKAASGDLEAMRNAAALEEAFKDSDEEARAAARDTVKGMRKVTKYEITDHKALLNWIAKNARDDLTAFIDEWARKHHKDAANVDGLRVWDEKEAF